MENKYEFFVEQLRKELLDATGYEEKQIYYKKKEDFPPTEDDRLVLKCSEANGKAEICALYIRELYLSYKKGRSMSEIVKAVMDRMQRISKAGILKKAEDINDYGKIKGDLFIRLLNRELHKAELNDAIYREMGDIAMVLYICMGEADGCMTSMKVKKYMLEEWGMDQNEIFDKALLNTYFFSPPRIYCWEKLVFNPSYSGDNFMNLVSDYSIRTDALGNCLSTTKRTNGAVAVFLPGVAGRIADLMNDDFYIVFTSIHEAMIHSVTSTDPETLRQVLEETVYETTPPEDFLTFQIYQYDRDTGEFCLAG